MIVSFVIPSWKRHISCIFLKKEKCYTEVYEMRFAFVVFDLIFIMIIILFTELPDRE